jgi:hypothetical protein
MLMTEKQAVLTWCPRMAGRSQQVMQRAEDFIAGFEEDDTQEGVTELLRDLRAANAEESGCIGSRCMAWRWKADPEAGRFASGQPMRVPTPERWACEHCKGVGEGCGECDGVGSGQVQAPVGFCGLAGPLEVLR